MEQKNFDLNNESKGFIDCIRALNLKIGGYGNQRVIGDKVYCFNLSVWKMAYDELCEKKEAHITYNEYIGWLNTACLLSNVTAQESLTFYANVTMQNEQERLEEERTAALVQEYRAEYENACDFLFYGEGFSAWYSMISDSIAEDDARRIWSHAHHRLSEDFRY